MSSPDPWCSRPADWTGPDPYIYYSFESNSNLNLFNGAEITPNGRVCCCFLLKGRLQNMVYLLYVIFGDYNCKQVVK